MTGVFANADDFGVAATYTPVSGQPVSTTVLFNKIYNAVDPLTGIVYEGERLTAQGAWSVFTGAPRNSTLVIDGTTYYIMTVEPPIDGECLLELSGSVQHG